MGVEEFEKCLGIAGNLDELCSTAVRLITGELKAEEKFNPATSRGTVSTFFDNLITDLTKITMEALSETVKETVDEGGRVRICGKLYQRAEPPVTPSENSKDYMKLLKRVEKLIRDDPDALDRFYYLKGMGYGTCKIRWCRPDLVCSSPTEITQRAKWLVDGIVAELLNASPNRQLWMFYTGKTKKKRLLNLINAIQFDTGVGPESLKLHYPEWVINAVNAKCRKYDEVVVLARFLIVATPAELKHASSVIDDVARIIAS
jgi:hypothetical protein